MAKGEILARLGTVTVVAFALLATTAACDHTVDGHPAAVPQSSGAATTPAKAADEPFVEHAVADECVLSGAEISALAEVSLKDGQDTSTKRSDGSYGRSCNYYLTAGGVLSFTASIKVLRPQQGPVTDTTIARLTTPTTRTLPGIGRAVLVEAKPDFPQAWVLTDRFAVRIFLVGSNLTGSPTDQRWAAAARLVVAKLPA
ncbi:hypothetical protein [Nocardia asiatica]|uniref:hypothetical protein n=1 Tax=Nocardia asiatica TaxID=209252 RepID=UPI002458F7ED|nr:hypothetical protein [Nocardia asiatica]